MNKEDIIEVSSYFLIPGVVRWGNYRDQPNYEPPPDKSVVAVSVDDTPLFFEMHGDNGRDYVVVSSASDFGPAIQSEMGWLWDAQRILEYFGRKYPHRLDATYQVSPKQFVNVGVDTKHAYCMRSQRGIYYSFDSIPDNILHWYCVNPYFSHDKITGIPFGVPEGSRDDLWMVKQENVDKVYDVYVNFNVNNNQIDREWVLDSINKGEFFKDCGIENPTVLHGGNLNRKDFYRQLASCRNCVCPPGNGMDSYRIYESIFLRSVPIYDTYSNLYSIYGCMVPYDKECGYLDDYKYYWDITQVDQILSLSYWKEQFWSHF